ncbi:MAG: hypothetical protein F6K11_12930 [Leptolyngbya sp. SIO3F4]|nr:hypothetical protein [Leptolyngbya sp. SIO3F4]
MVLATDKKKVSAYLEPDLKEDAEALAKARRMSLSTLIAVLLDREVKEAKKQGEGLVRDE